MDNSKIGKFIKKLREEKDWNQEELAEKIYVSRSNLSDIENGKTMLSPDKALLLGKLFNVSIIDIYNGQILDKNDIVKTNETINVISEKVVKSTKLRYTKIILGIVLCFGLIIFTFLAYYFFNSYNSVKFYKVMGESENFETNEGLFVVSKENINFSINVNAKNEQKINYISLRYKDDDQDELIQKVSDNYIYLTDYYNYNEFFDYNKVIKEKGNYYIEVEYENEKEIIDLAVIKQYENKRVFFSKETPITTGESSHPREPLNIPEKVLKEFTYDEYGNYSYHKKMNNYDVYIWLVPDAYQLIACEEYKDRSVCYLYFMLFNELSYSDAKKDSEELYTYEKINKENNYTAYVHFFDEYYDKYFK